MKDNKGNPVSIEQLQEIFAKHQMWLNDEEGGERANLSGWNLESANLYSANLYSANLYSANLERANLERANLYSANLYSANLERANLERANLYSANLYSANLYSANLYSANLYSANLERANLESANLESANLERANLERANLERANLESANLERANLGQYKADMWNVLFAAPNEAQGLRQAIIEGKINGSCYEGECCCLVGTIANIRGENYNELSGIEPDGSRPIEQWFMKINPGNTPENNFHSKMALKWLDEWIARVEVMKIELQIGQNTLAAENAVLRSYIVGPMSFDVEAVAEELEALNTPETARQATELRRIVADAEAMLRRLDDK